jgi:hypothetical protein
MKNKQVNKFIELVNMVKRIRENSKLLDAIRTCTDKLDLVNRTTRPSNNVQLVDGRPILSSLFTFARENPHTFPQLKPFEDLIVKLHPMLDELRATYSDALIEKTDDHWIIDRGAAKMLAHDGIMYQIHYVQGETAEDEDELLVDFYTEYFAI